MAAAGLKQRRGADQAGVNECAQYNMTNNPCGPHLPCEGVGLWIGSLL